MWTHHNSSLSFLFQQPISGLRACRSDLRLDQTCEDLGRENERKVAAAHDRIPFVLRCTPHHETRGSC